MPVSVIKFGGTSLSDISHIKRAAEIVLSEHKKGRKIVVVTSAMSGTTNRIISMCQEVSSLKTEQMQYDYDSALSTGESFAASLFALALQELGLKSRSVHSWQLKILSTIHPINSLITSVEVNLLESLINEDIIPVVTGFQAVNEQGRITTIGRGGSDTTAAAISAALDSSCCDIYTDVEGIFSADPRLIENSKVIDQISYDQAIELAGSGAKVIHPRAIKICQEFNIPIRIFSTFSQKLGSIIMNNVNELRKIDGITYLKNLKIYALERYKKDESNKYINKNLIEKNTISNFISKLINTGINIQSILSCNEYYELRFTASNEFYYKILEIFKSADYKYNIKDKVACISIIGSSINHNLNIFSKIIQTLENEKIDILDLINSETKIAIYIDESHVEQTVKLLHKKLIEDE